MVGGREGGGLVRGRGCRLGERGRGRRLGGRERWCRVGDREGGRLGERERV